MTENIKSIISQVVKINEKYDAIKKLNGETFNIFSILNMERNEVETHSKFIYELLNPKGTHNQGSLFLNLFISDVLGLVDYKKIKYVKREDLTSENRRIDFTIETEVYQIGIEMKIDARDQDMQLLDYSKELKNRCNNMQQDKLYYLTLSGYEAEVSSTSKKLKLDEDYKLLSFEVDILNWIDRCIEKSATIPTLREGLVHYRNLIRKITNKLPDTMEHDMENIIRGARDIEAMQTILNDYPRIWAKKEMDFWDSLWNKIESKCEKYNFEFVDDYNIWSDEDGMEYTESEVIQGIREKRDKKYYIVGFLLKKIYKDKTSIKLRVTEWDTTISFYLSFFDENENHKMTTSLIEICKGIGFNRKDGNERYKNIDEEITFYGRYKTKPTYELFDDINFKNYVDNAADNVVEIIKYLSDNQKSILKKINEK